MKKGIIFTILAAMILTFCGCGKQQTKDHSLKESSVSSSSEISQEEISADTESSVLPEQSSKQESKEKTVSSDESEASLEFVDFSGEAQDYTLEDFYKSPEAKVIIETAKNEYKSDMYDIDVKTADDHTVVVTATIKEGTDPSLYNDDMIESYFNSAESQADMYIKMLETTTTTKDINILARIQTADGTEIGSRTFTRQKSADEESTDEEPLTLKDIIETGAVKNALDSIAGGFGDGTAKITTSVENSRLIINIQLEQCVPDEGVSVIKQQLENTDNSISAVERQLRAITGDSSVSVSVNVIDACGNIVASRN